MKTGQIMVWIYPLLMPIHNSLSHIGYKTVCWHKHNIYNYWSIADMGFQFYILFSPVMVSLFLIISNYIEQAFRDILWVWIKGQWFHVLPKYYIGNIVHAIIKLISTQVNMDSLHTSRRVYTLYWHRTTLLYLGRIIRWALSVTSFYDN